MVAAGVPSTVGPSQICNCVALTSVITHSTRKITVSESRLSRTLPGRALRGLGQQVGIINVPPQAYPRRTGLSAARPGKSGANSSQMRSASPLPFRESPGDPKMTRAPSHHPTAGPSETTDDPRRKQPDDPRRRTWSARTEHRRRRPPYPFAGGVSRSSRTLPRSNDTDRSY